MDLSRISTEDLQALRTGKLSDVSKGALLDIKRQQESLPSDVVNEPGLEKVPGPITNALTLGIGGASEATAGLPMLGKVAKNIIDTPENTLNAVKSIPEVATSVGRGLKSVASEGIGKLQNLADAIMGQGEKAATLTADQMTAPARQAVQDTTTALKGASNPTPDLLAAQQDQAGLGLKYGQEKARLLDARKTAGQAIGDVEEANGLGFKELPDNFQKVLRDKELLGQKANTMARLADKGPDFLSQILTLKRCRLIVNSLKPRLKLLVLMT